MKRRVHLIIWALLLAGCAAQQRNGDASNGRLKVRTNDIAMIGVRATIRGTIQNTFDQPVHGVRFMVTIYDTRTSEKVGVWQRAVDETINPGERTPVNLQVESDAMVGRNARFTIRATPVKLGSKSIPPPAGWKD